MAEKLALDPFSPRGLGPLPDNGLPPPELILAHVVAMPELILVASIPPCSWGRKLLLPNLVHSLGYNALSPALLVVF